MNNYQVLEQLQKSQNNNLEKTNKIINKKNILNNLDFSNTEINQLNAPSNINSSINQNIDQNLEINESKIEEDIFGTLELSEEERNSTNNIFNPPFIKEFINGNEDKIMELSYFVSKRIKTFKNQQELEEFINQCEQKILNVNNTNDENTEIYKKYYKKLIITTRYLYEIWQKISESTDIYKTSNELKTKSIYPIMTIEGLIFQEIIPTNDSFYRAVCLAINAYTPNYLRNFTITFIKKNINKFSALILKNQISVENYINTIKSRKQPAGEVEIIALMWRLRRPIVVINREGVVCNLHAVKEFLEAVADSNSLNEINENNEHSFDSTPIFVCYSNKDHYDALLVDKEYSAKKILKELINNYSDSEEINNTIKLNESFKMLQKEVLYDYKVDINDYIEYSREVCKKLFNNVIQSGAEKELCTFMAMLAKSVVNLHIFTMAAAKNTYEKSRKQRKVYIITNNKLNEIKEKQDKEVLEKEEKDVVILNKQELSKEDVKKEVEQSVNEKCIDEKEKIIKKTLGTVENVIDNAPSLDTIINFEDRKQANQLCEDECKNNIKNMENCTMLPFSTLIKTPLPFSDSVFLPNSQALFLMTRWELVISFDPKTLTALENNKFYCIKSDQQWNLIFKLPKLKKNIRLLLSSEAEPALSCLLQLLNKIPIKCENKQQHEELRILQHRILQLILTYAVETYEEFVEKSKLDHPLKTKPHFLLNKFYFNDDQEITFLQQTIEVMHKIPRQQSAIYGNYLNLVHFLLFYLGDNPIQKNKHGKSALDLAVQYELWDVFTAIIQYLETRGVAVTYPFPAGMKNSFDLLKQVWNTQVEFVKNIPFYKQSAFLVKLFWIGWKYDAGLQLTIDNLTEVFRAVDKMVKTRGGGTENINEVLSKLLTHNNFWWGVHGRKYIESLALTKKNLKEETKKIDFDVYGNKEKKYKKHRKQCLKYNKELFEPEELNEDEQKIVFPSKNTIDTKFEEHDVKIAQLEISNAEITLSFKKEQQQSLQKQKEHDNKINNLENTLESNNKLFQFQKEEYDNEKKLSQTKIEHLEKENKELKNSNNELKTGFNQQKEKIDRIEQCMLLMMNKLPKKNNDDEFSEEDGFTTINITSQSSQFNTPITHFNSQVNKKNNIVTEQNKELNK